MRVISLSKKAGEHLSENVQCRFTICVLQSFMAVNIMTVKENVGIFGYHNNV